MDQCVQMERILASFFVFFGKAVLPAMIGSLSFAILLIVVFTVFSGFNDGGNLLATFMSTRIMNGTAVLAILLVTVFVGPLIAGTAVAHTFGTQIVSQRYFSMAVLNLALLATLATLFVCWRIKVPTSTTFALVGGLCGAGIVVAGPEGIVWFGVIKSMVSLVLAVMLGGSVGFLVYAAMQLVLRRVSLQVGRRIGYLQYGSAVLVSIGYGANDAEKSIGLFATAWASALGQHEFHTPWWIFLVSTMVFGVGVVSGGWRIAKTVGNHVFQVRPTHALATQLSTACVVLTASFLGGPVSTTQTLDSSLVGIGVRARKQKIRWAVVRKIVFVWVFTMPTSFVIGAVLGLVYRLGGWLF